MIYLDHNATAPLHPAAAEVWREHLQAGHTANPSSLHRTGQQARATLDEARRSLATRLGARAGELIFTSSGTEANALALCGALAYARKGRRRMLASAVEHASVLATVEACAREHPEVEVELLPVDRNGVLDLAAAEAALRPDVFLVSLMLGNNETGVLQPVRELALLARAHGILLHCDAAQAVGKVPVNVSDLGVDLLSAGAHKFGGGLGCGLLVQRQGISLRPLLPGHQETGRRGGTENVAAAAAAAAALRAATSDLEATALRLGALRDHLERTACAQVPRTRVNGSPAPRLPNTSNLEFEGTDGEALIIALDLAGVSVSTGAACASGTLEPSHVLLAMGLRPDQAKASVRFSLGHATTEQEIDILLRLLPPLVERVRAHAPTGQAL